MDPLTWPPTAPAGPSEDQPWARIQAMFVESPAAAVREADEHVSEILRARGVTMERFEDRVAWVARLSDEAATRYRRAYAVRLALRAQRVDTEDLRVALVDYRGVLDSILEETRRAASAGLQPSFPPAEAPVARRAS